MKHYNAESIADAWVQACKHHLEYSENVMDLDICKAHACCLSIAYPAVRVPSPETNPFIPFFLTVLAMTEQDQNPELIKQYIPELAGFRDQTNGFSLAMGARLREFAGYDQFQMLHESLRLGMQVVPIVIFNAEQDHSLQHRPSTLSVVFSIYADKVHVLVTIDSLLLHSVPFHSELSIISMWQEMLCAFLGKRIGVMDVVCGATAALQSDADEFRRVVSEPACSPHQNLYVMGDESDPEVLISDFKTWPLVSVGRGYLSAFFKHTVIPMTMTHRALQQPDIDLQTKKENAFQAARAIGDMAWRTHVTKWIENCFVE